MSAARCVISQIGCRWRSVRWTPPRTWTFVFGNAGSQHVHGQDVTVVAFGVGRESVRPSDSNEGEPAGARHLRQQEDVADRDRVPVPGPRPLAATPRRALLIVEGTPATLGHER